jgi:diguanylate cyclase (GGDEF)-like protein
MTNGGMGSPSAAKRAALLFGCLTILAVIAFVWFRANRPVQAVALAALSFLLGWLTSEAGLLGHRRLPALAPTLRRIGDVRSARGQASDAGRAVEIKVIEGNESTDSTSFVDSVTGLANRRYLDTFLGREVGRAQRFSKPVSVAVFNVDGAFKLPPDAVEQALVEIGKRLTDGLRDYDVVARYSQAKLLVVLPETPTDEALEVTERLRESVASLKVDKTQVNVSVGLATFPEDGSSAEELINAAHHFLNRGKLESPDQVHCPQRLAKAG